MDKRYKQKNKKNADKGKNVATPAKNKNAKRPTISFQKRNKLNALVAELWKLSVNNSKTSPDTDFAEYVKIQMLLAEILTLEAPLRRENVNATSEARLEHIDAFYKWATENGLKTDCVKIAEFPGYDLGLMATRDIAKDEEICTVPRKLMLSEESLDKHVNDQLCLGSMTNIKLAYVLIIEVMKETSFWKPYIDLLPEKYTNVLYFTLEEMSALRNSCAISAALRQCKSIAMQYALIYNCAHKETRTNNGTEISKIFAEQFNYDLYRWAVSTVMTRENLIPCKPAEDNLEAPPVQIAALIPFWDMANHCHGTITSYYNMENNVMDSTAQSDFKAGEQVFIHYGERFNSDLMIHNGFVNPTHPNDGVYIKLGLSASDPLKVARAELLSKMKLSKSSSLSVLKAPKYISPQLLAFVRIFNMNKEQLDHWSSCGRELDLLHNDCALETSLEVKTWKYLEVRLMLLTRSYPTQLTEDEEKLKLHKTNEKKLGHIEVMILEFLIAEKRILLEALDYARQRTKT